MSDEQKRGGHRPGAGAPRKFDAPVKPRSIAMTEEHYAALDEMAEAKGVNTTVLIRDILVRSINAYQRKRDA
jgi:Ribbon-helix-helix protein, copG family